MKNSVHFIMALALLPLLAHTAAAMPQPLGSYWHGHLNHGINARTYFAQRPERSIEFLSPASYEYGTLALFETIESISQYLNAQWGQRFHVQLGDTALERGGKIARHVAHQNGLDADIAYLAIRARQVGHRSEKFNNRFRQEYVANGKLDANFDLESNYRLLKHIANTNQVSHIFVGCTIKHAFQNFHVAGENAAERDVLLKHLVVNPHHDDHFHIRVRCPAGATQCENDTEWHDIDCDGA